MSSEQFQEYLKTTNEIGFVEEAVSALSYVSGLPDAKIDEIVLFETGETGYVVSLKPDICEVMVFSKIPLRIGTRVVRTGQILQIPVGDEYLGQIIDPFGNLIDKFKPFTKPTTLRPIDQDPQGIERRKKITTSFDTGVSIVDMLIPLGKGQRQLIIGDRKTGKTSFLYQTIINQSKSGTICIYAAIGKNKYDIKQTEEVFTKANIMAKTVIVASPADDPLSTIFITPYTAMTLAEYFRDTGRNVLLILDDMTNHAKFYRELGLIGKRFPGRNAYPGDIFYSHSRLLERAGNFIYNPAGNDKDPQPPPDVSITCLPVVETVQGDISGYIQTNVMSMTDGHIYFDTEMFAKGRRPAINPFLSVTRVGRQTQTDLRRTISRELTSFLTLYEKIENFSHFGAEASVSIKETLETGEKITAYFTQTADVVIDQNVQIFVFALLWYGIWKGQMIEDMKADISKIISLYRADPTLKQQIQQMLSGADSLNSFMNILRPRIAGIVQYLKLEHVNLKMASIDQPTVSKGSTPTQTPPTQPTPAMQQPKG